MSPPKFADRNDRARSPGDAPPAAVCVPPSTHGVQADSARPGLVSTGADIPSVDIPSEDFPEDGGSPECRRFAREISDCVIERRSLSDLVAGPSAPEWVGHRLGCVPCAGRWSEALFLEQAFDLWTSRRPETDLPEQFADSILARLAAAAETEGADRGLTTAGRAPRLTVLARAARVDPSGKVSGASLGAQRAMLSFVAAMLVALALILSIGRRTGIEAPGLSLAGPERTQPTAPARAAPDRAEGVAPGSTPATRTDQAITSNAGNDSANGPNRATDADQPVVLATLLAEAGSACRSLAVDAADVVRDAAAVVAVRRSEEDRAFPPADAEFTPPTDRRLPWTLQIENAVDFLWDAIPQTEAPPT